MRNMPPGVALQQQYSGLIQISIVSQYGPAVVIAKLFSR